MKMTNNDNLIELIPDYLSGRLGEKDKFVFEEQLASDRSLQQEVDALKPFFSNMEQTNYYSNFEVESRSLTAGVLSKLDNRKKAKRTKTYISWAGLAVSAMILIVVGINVIQDRTNNASNSPTDFVDVVQIDTSINYDTNHNIAAVEKKVEADDIETVSDKAIDNATETIIEENEEVIEEVMDLDDVIYEAEIEKSNINEIIEVIEDVTIL